MARSRSAIRRHPERALALPDEAAEILAQATVALPLHLSLDAQTMERGWQALP